MVTCMVAINAMPVTNAKVPVVLDLSKVFNDKISILVSFTRLGRYVTSSTFVSYFSNRIIHTGINRTLLVGVISKLQRRL